MGGCEAKRVAVFCVVVCYAGEELLGRGIFDLHCEEGIVDFLSYPKWSCRYLFCGIIILFKSTDPTVANSLECSSHLHGQIDA